jgi:hypothetical protein
MQKKLIKLLLFPSLLLTQNLKAQNKLRIEFDTAQSKCNVIYMMHTILSFHPSFNEKIKLSEDSLLVVHYCYEDARSSYIEVYDKYSNNIQTIKIENLVVTDCFLSPKKKLLVIGYRPQNEDFDLKKMNSESAMEENIYRLNSNKYAHFYNEKKLLIDSITLKSSVSVIPLDSQYFLLSTNNNSFKKFGLYTFYLLDDQFNIVKTYSNKNKFLIDVSQKPRYNPKLGILNLFGTIQMMDSDKYPYSQLTIYFIKQKEEVK